MVKSSDEREHIPDDYDSMVADGDASSIVLHYSSYISYYGCGYVGLSFHLSFSVFIWLHKVMRTNTIIHGKWIEDRNLIEVGYGLETNIIYGHYWCLYSQNSTFLFLFLALVLLHASLYDAFASAFVRSFVRLLFITIAHTPPYFGRGLLSFASVNILIHTYSVQWTPCYIATNAYITHKPSRP